MADKKVNIGKICWNFRNKCIPHYSRHDDLSDQTATTATAPNVSFDASSRSTCSSIYEIGSIMLDQIHLHGT